MPRSPEVCEIARRDQCAADRATLCPRSLAGPAEWWTPERRPQSAQPATPRVPHAPTERTPPPPQRPSTRGVGSASRERRRTCSGEQAGASQRFLHKWLFSRDTLLAANDHLPRQRVRRLTTLFCVRSHKQFCSQSKPRQLTPNMIQTPKALRHLATRCRSRLTRRRRNSSTSPGFARSSSQLSATPSTALFLARSKIPSSGSPNLCCGNARRSSFQLDLPTPEPPQLSNAMSRIKELDERRAGSPAGGCTTQTSDARREHTAVCPRDTASRWSRAVCATPSGQVRWREGTGYSSTAVEATAVEPALDRRTSLFSEDNHKTRKNPTHSGAWSM